MELLKRVPIVTYYSKLKENGPQRELILLGGVEGGTTLLEKAVTVEVDFEVSYKFKPLPLTPFTSCCFWIKM